VNPFRWLKASAKYANFADLQSHQSNVKNENLFEAKKSSHRLATQIEK
jgi:hypothetical protein